VLALLFRDGVAKNQIEKCDEHAGPTLGGGGVSAGAVDPGCKNKGAHPHVHKLYTYVVLHAFFIIVVLQTLC
jgi:hypothetical protein